MKASEYRLMSLAELESQLEKAREELMNYRFRLTSGELKDVSQIRATRRKIACLLTILREKKQELTVEGQ